MSTRKAIIALAVLLMVLPAVPRVSALPGGGRPLVCIDPGHGGDDPGAIGNGLEEKDLNLDIALRARPLVEAMGYEVMMTRESDETVSLKERCEIANRAGATIFVSIHNNAFYSKHRGTETYCYYDSYDGRRLATLVHEEVLKRIDLKDRGVKEAGFYVLKNTAMPAALLEGAFITNKKDAKLLARPTFRQKIAEGVASGINGYLIDPGRFDEYLLLMNPDNEETAEVEITFMKVDGHEKSIDREVPPRSRVTVHVDDYIWNTDVSALVRSVNGVPIVAERSVYFDFEKGRGGHDAPGVTAPSRRWYLAEGSTAWGFSTFILVQNPGEKENPVVLRFIRSDGETKSLRYDLGPHSRFTLDASTVRGFEENDFSVNVVADHPVVVERAMYFMDHFGLAGGHDSHGVTSASRSWYLAEGYTGEGFHTYVLLENPNDQDAMAHIFYLLSEDTVIDEIYEIPAHSRKTICLNEVPGLSGKDVSVRVSANLPVVVERSMYFDYWGIREGSNSVAATAPSKDWYLPEGYTGNGFDTYLLIMNPGAEDTVARILFMTAEGHSTKKWMHLPARSRRTVFVNREEGLGNAEVSTHVTSEQPVVVERSMYFRTGNRLGGHVAMGIIQPALEWYFAEGCTR